MAKKDADIKNDINKRILLFMEAQGFKPSEFADYLGIPRPRMTHIKNGRNKPNVDFIITMLEKFPNLNPNWLLLGEGPMYKERKTSDNQDTEEVKEVKQTESKTESEKQEQELAAKQQVSEPNQQAQQCETQPVEQPSSQQQQAPPQSQPQYQSQPLNQPGTQPQTNQQSGQQGSGQAIVMPGPDGSPVQILILFPDRTFVAYRSRD